MADGPFLVALARLVEVGFRRWTPPGSHHGGTVVENIAWTIPILAAEEGGGSMLHPILLFGVPILLFWLLLIRPQQQAQQRERRNREAMLAALKKNDRVVTVGGIYGVVTNVHREADEVTIKVDEAANVKLRVTLSSVAQVKRKDESSSDSSA